MTIVAAKTNTYGPGTLDIQLEQGADFGLTLRLLKNAAAWDLTSVTLVAKMATDWTPSSEEDVSLTVTKTAAVDKNEITVGLTAAQTAAIVPPKTTPTGPGPANAPRKIKLGGWVLDATEGGVVSRLLEGDVWLDRDPQT